jgi:hypothetical protein
MAAFKVISSTPESERPRNDAFKHAGGVLLKNLTKPEFLA